MSEWKMMLYCIELKGEKIRVWREKECIFFKWKLRFFGLIFTCMFSLLLSLNGLINGARWYGNLEWLWKRRERRWKREKREIPSSYSLKVLLLLQIPFSFLSFKQWVSALTQLHRALIPSFLSFLSRSFSPSPRKTRNKTFLLDNILLFSHLLIFVLSFFSFLSFLLSKLILSFQNSPSRASLSTICSEIIIASVEFFWGEGEEREERGEKASLQV